MNSMKRLGLAALLVALGALFAAPQAFARNTEDKLTYELVAPEIDPPEPEAFGQYTLTDDSAVPGWPQEVDLSCRGLTPWKQYRVVLLVFWQDIPGDTVGGWSNWGLYEQSYLLIADNKSRISHEFTIMSYDKYVAVVDLWIENDVGQVVLETGLLVRSK